MITYECGNSDPLNTGDLSVWVVQNLGASYARRQKNFPMPPVEIYSFALLGLHSFIAQIFDFHLTAAISMEMIDT